MLRIIAGTAKNRRLKKVDSKFELRPTSDKVRESLFNILGDRIAGAKVLDLFAGTGAVGFEAISRGAANCVSIENNINHYKLIKENLKLLELSEYTTYLKEVSTAIHILYKKKKKFDIIFLDPPYFKNYGEKTIREISNYEILEEDGIVVWEHQKSEHASEIIGGLHLKRQYVYGNITLSLYENIIEGLD